MKIECTRDSKWSNPKNGGSQTFKQGQVLVVGEDVKEARAEEMLRCDYAKKVGGPIVEETKASEASQEKNKVDEKKSSDKSKSKGAGK